VCPKVIKMHILCRNISTHSNNLKSWKHTLVLTNSFWIHLIPVIKNTICTTKMCKSVAVWRINGLTPRKYLVGKFSTNSAGITFSKI
jgi:hypothetical protein